MKRQILICLAIVAGLIVWGNQAMAIKVVAKSSNDSAQSKTTPPAPDKSADAKSAQPTVPASSGQAQSPSSPVVHPAPPQDNFTDRDGDGINDNIRQHKEPEIKRDKIEPSRKTEQPQRSEPTKTPESKKADDQKTSSGKH